MNKTIIAVLASVVVASFALPSRAAQPEPTESDVGSCYSMRPICIGTSPVCVCNISMNCFWMCR